MNTFIIDDDPIKCAQLLDYKRLGKQRVECIQILNAINSANQNGWINHPCIKMWKDHELSLRYYTNCMIEEWLVRGYKNTIAKFTEYETNMPWWFYCKMLQNSHIASLLRKNKTYYQEIFDIKNYEKYMEFSYIWISKLSKEQIELLKTNANVDISLLAEKV